MTHHPSLFVVGVLAFVVLAHNTDGRMQALGAGIYLSSVLLFLLCRSGKDE